MTICVCGSGRMLVLSFFEKIELYILWEWYVAR